MRVDVIEKSELGREIVFEIPEEKVREEKVSIVEEIKKNAEVKGFRKGNAPESVIEEKYADTIKENLIKRIVPEAYAETLKEKGLEPAVEPEMYDISFDNGMLKYKIYLELKPEVKIDKYKGISYKKQNPQEVTEEQVEGALASLGKKPEFASAMADPEKRKAWKDRVRSQLEQNSAFKASSEEEAELWKALLDNSDFSVPPKLLRQRAASRAHEELGRMNLKNMSQEEKERTGMEVFDEVKPSVEIDIKKFFILDKVATLENIEVLETDIDERISVISRSAGQPAEEIKKKIIENGRMDDLKDEIRINKAFRFIKENASPVKQIIVPGDAGSGGKR